MNPKNILSLSLIVILIQLQAFESTKTLCGNIIDNKNKKREEIPNYKRHLDIQENLDLNITFELMYI